ncbi:Transglutaminase-like superfamily protein [Candidatus Gugararchaeum adminiculabundum]|nr:Transglutaminase-like superfamily protein [Candidatus Gugararchaeum adminiculabundum]
MRASFALISILLLSALALADVYYPAEIKVENVGELETQVNATWTIVLDGDVSTLEEVHLVVFGFSNYSSQYVKSFSASPQPALNISGNGEDYSLDFTWKNPQSNTLEATAQFVLVTNFQNNSLTRPQPFPFDSQVGFLKDSPLVFINDEMNAQTQAFSQDTSDAFQIAAGVSEWVHNNMVYDLQYAEVNLTAPEAFAIRRGVCDEYSHLAAAFMRHLGIPAKVSVGYVFSGESWGLHSWIEIYSPENNVWISTDPTFNEMGVLDATHLRMVSVEDQSYASEESSMVGSDHVGMKLLRNVSISVIRSQDLAKHATLSVIGSEFNITAETIYANVSNPFDEYIFAPVTIREPLNSTLFGESDRLVYLKPHETRQLEWVVSFPGLEKGFVYTYSITVSTLGEEKEIHFSKSPGPKEDQIPIGGTTTTRTKSPCQVSVAILALIPAILFVRRN